LSFAPGSIPPADYMAPGSLPYPNPAVAGPIGGPGSLGYYAPGNLPPVGGVPVASGGSAPGDIGVNPVASLLGRTGPTGIASSAHHSFLASVIAHLLGAAGAGIHGFGPGGGVALQSPGHPSPPGYGPAQALHGLGANAQAAQVWEQHHPAAVAGRAPVPHWVTQALLAAIHAHTPQQAAAPPVPSFQAQ